MSKRHKTITDSQRESNNLIFKALTAASDDASAEYNTCNVFQRRRFVEKEQICRIFW